MRTRLFLDLDDTLANFSEVDNIVNRFRTEPNLFEELKPLKGLENINNLINNKSIDVFIISASLNAISDYYKSKWIDKNLTNINKNNIVFCRLGENKAEVITKKLNTQLSDYDYLLDDYTKNLEEWTAFGGRGIKKYNDQPHSIPKRWQGLAIKDLEDIQNVINL